MDKLREQIASIIKEYDTSSSPLRADIVIMDLRKLLALQEQPSQPIQPGELIKLCNDLERENDALKAKLPTPEEARAILPKINAPWISDPNHTCPECKQLRPAVAKLLSIIKEGK